MCASIPLQCLFQLSSFDCLLGAVVTRSLVCSPTQIESETRKERVEADFSTTSRLTYQGAQVPPEDATERFSQTAWLMKDTWDKTTVAEKFGGAKGSR